jgi:hypothetical protein
LPNQSPIPSHTPPVAASFQASAPANLENSNSAELPTISNDSNSNISNDANVDLAAAAMKKRNRRKPNKTTKVFNDDEAHLGLPEEDDDYSGRFNGIASNGLEAAKTTNETVVVNGSPTAGSFPIDQPTASAQMNNGNGGSVNSSAAPVVVANSLGNNNGSVCDSREHSDDKPTPVAAAAVNESVNNGDGSVAADISQADGALTKGQGKAASLVTSTPTNAAAPTAKKRGRRKAVKPVEESVDSEVETIDKIAEMISNTSTEFDRTAGDGDGAAKDPLATGSTGGKEANYEDVSSQKLRPYRKIFALFCHYFEKSK